VLHSELSFIVAAASDVVVLLLQSDSLDVADRQPAFLKDKGDTFAAAGNYMYVGQGTVALLQGHTCYRTVCAYNVCICHMLWHRNSVQD
jgi:hypothetical protein